MQSINVVTVTNNDKTVVKLNVSSHKQTPPKQVSSIAAAARKVYGNLMPQYLNALTIATELAITDTSTMPIFIIVGVNAKTSHQQRIH